MHAIASWATGLTLEPIPQGIVNSRLHSTHLGRSQKPNLLFNLKIELNISSLPVGGDLEHGLMLPFLELSQRIVYLGRLFEQGNGNH